MDKYFVFLFRSYSFLEYHTYSIYFITYVNHKLF